MPPKRKATTRLSALVDSDNEDKQRENERPAKKQRGRPRSKSIETKPPVQSKRNSTAAQAQAPDSAPKKTIRRGRPKGSRNSAQGAQEESKQESDPQQQDNAATSNDELDESQKAPKATGASKSTKSATTRGRRKVSAEQQVKTDGGFEYTPRASRQTKAPIESPEETEPPKRQSRRSNRTEVEESLEEAPEQQEIVDETVLHDEPVIPRSASASPVKSRQSFHRALGSSPLKRRPGGSAEDNKTSEPELRRRLGELTKKYDLLENRFRNLKEIGIVEANANMDKLRQHCEVMGTASNNLIQSLKAELEAQKKLGQQSRTLQKQLKEQAAEAAQFKSQAEETKSQLTSAQNEIKALHTKLAAARNTTASLESAAAKVPGSAIKNGNASRAANAEAAQAAQAAQLAQLKEELYSDLTGLVILDVKKQESNHLYDCLQTGVNGTLHFKLAVPLGTSTNYETAEFQYVPLLDENRDRELVDILPEYLTVDITFVRQQASKFYTRVIDALTKRRNSST